MIRHASASAFCGLLFLQLMYSLFYRSIDKILFGTLKQMHHLGPLLLLAIFITSFVTVHVVFFNGPHSYIVVKEIYGIHVKLKRAQSPYSW